jgi:hypothetical protein
MRLILKSAKLEKIEVKNTFNLKSGIRLSYKRKLAHLLVRHI